MKITYSDPNNVVQLTRWVGDPFGVGVHRPSRSIASKYTISTCIVKKRQEKNVHGGSRRVVSSLLPIYPFSVVVGCCGAHLPPSRRIADAAAVSVTWRVFVIGRVKVAWAVRHVEVGWWPSLDVVRVTITVSNFKFGHICKQIEQLACVWISEIWPGVHEKLKYALWNGSRYRRVCLDSW